MNTKDKQNIEQSTITADNASTVDNSDTGISSTVATKGGPGSGGSRKGAGRPKKILADTDPYDPVKTLKLLKFDPIVAAVEALKEVDQKVRWMKRQTKPSMPAIAQLLNTKRALVNDLLRFGYRPIPEKTISELQFVPIDITLTDQPMSDIGIERLSFGDLDLKSDLLIENKDVKH